MNDATKSAIWRAQRHLLAVASPNWMRRLRLTMQGSGEGAGVGDSGEVNQPT